MKPDNTFRLLPYSRMLFGLMGYFCILCACAIRSQAHRLDECLQATRLEIRENFVAVEWDITPGLEVASAWLRVVDSNGDGRLDELEKAGYADLVCRELKLQINGTFHKLKMEEVHFAATEELRTGNGVVRIRCKSSRVRWKRGENSVEWVNRHFRDHSVYLANTLMPQSRRIEVTRQQRDATQSTYEVSFRFKGR